MDLNRKKFEKARNERDKIIENAIHSYRYKTYEPPEVVIQRVTFEWVDKQVQNKKNGLDFAKSWQQVIVADDEEMKKYVDFKNSSNNETVVNTNDGKDWSLSTDEFKLFISGENKEVVNKSAFDEDPKFKFYGNEFISKDTKQMWNRNKVDDNDENYSPNELNRQNDNSLSIDELKDMIMDDEFEYEELQRTNNLDQLDINKMKLEDFKGRPDQITDIELKNIASTCATLSWKIPDSNNSSIAEYTVDWAEIDLDTLEHNFKWTYRSEENSVTIEDLLPNSWYSIDIRAENFYGMCPIKSKFFVFKTTSGIKGDLYSWGYNESLELAVSEEDVKSTKMFNRDKQIHNFYYFKFNIYL